MKVLAVSDKVVEFIYSPSLVERFRGVDLVLSCGDLPYYYLEYIITMLNVPLLYVHGNHDPPIEYAWSGHESTGPAGGINVHGRLVQQKGLTVVGLEGSIRYRPQGLFQYTDAEMWRQVFMLAPSLLLNRLIARRPMDILLTHSPPYGIHNGHDYTHAGFKAFLWLMQQFKPRFLLHGHHHVYSPLEATETQFEQTMVINVYPYKVLEIDV